MDGLGTRVSNLRSQGLNFARDGIEFTLDIPDTRDVKDIMGTMVNTITTQDSQIGVLQAELLAAAEKNARIQQELQQWAAKCLDELRDESNLLKKKLEQSQQQLRNFTFNIQGFEDASLAGPPKTPKVKKTPKAAEQQALPEPKPEKVVETGFAMFSTEQGGSPDKLTREASKTIEEAAGSGEAKADKIASRQVSFREGGEAVGGGAEERVRDEPLPALSPLKRLQKQKTHSKKTPPDELRALWRKAIKEVINTNRVRRLGYGLSSTRVKKSQSVY